MSAISNLTNALKPYLDVINQIHGTDYILNPNQIQIRFINDELDIR